VTARRTARRSGYTLIELLVASAIATLLMLALYSAFDLTVTQTEIGRERVAHTDLARSIIGRMSNDLSCSLGLLPPQSGQVTEDAAASSAAVAEDPMPVETEPASATDTSATGGLLPFQAGVVGDSQQVTLFVSKVPGALLARSSADGSDINAEQVLPPGLKRITYYLGSNGGLCRQERDWVTATGTGDATALDTSNESEEVLAPEVTAVSFEYLNGTGWDSSWDGGSAALDDSAMMGPPRAIRATLTFELLGDDGQTIQKTVVHVFPVRASIGNATTSTGGQP